MEEEEKKDIFQTPSQFESRMSRKSEGGGIKKLIVILVSIVVIGLLIFGVLKFVVGNKTATTTTNPTPTPESFPTDIPQPTDTPAETPSVSITLTPTPAVSVTPTKAAATSSVDKATGLDRAKLSIHILNGSGTSGASKKASDLLEGLGYNIIQIGNADNFDYTDTEIQTTSAQSKYIPLLKKDLSGTYTVGKTTSDLTDPTEHGDAIVIIGK